MKGRKSINEIKEYDPSLDTANGSPRVKKQGTTSKSKVKK